MPEFFEVLLVQFTVSELTGETHFMPEIDIYAIIF